MSVTAGDIAGVLKGSKAKGGGTYGADIPMMTALALAQKANGSWTANREGWWLSGVHDDTIDGIKRAALIVLEQHQHTFNAQGWSDELKMYDMVSLMDEYRNKAYIPYLPQATAAAAAAPTIDNSNGTIDQALNNAQDKIDGATDWASSLGDFLGGLTNSHTWLRIVWGVAGVGLVFLGLSMMFHPQVEQVARAAAEVL